MMGALERDSTAIEWKTKALLSLSPWLLLAAASDWVATDHPVPQPGRCSSAWVEPGKSLLQVASAFVLKMRCSLSLCAHARRTAH